MCARQLNSKYFISFQTDFKRDYVNKYLRDIHIVRADTFYLFHCIVSFL